MASPFSTVADDACGSAEQTVAQLDRAIIENGGRSLVIANESSSVGGTLIPISKGQTWSDLQETIEDTLRYGSIDLIHFHDIDFHRYLPDTEIPKLITLHSPPTRYPRSVFTDTRNQNAFLHCVSQTQHEQCPNSDALLSPITDEDFAPKYLRRYEIIIRGCAKHANAHC